MLKEVAEQKVIMWLRQKEPNLDKVQLDQDLMAEGILKSLQFMDFMLYIEELRNEKIPQESIDPENFATIRKILDAFF